MVLEKNKICIPYLKEWVVMKTVVAYRMVNDRLVKAITDYKPHGKRYVRRLQHGWLLCEVNTGI